MALNPEQILKEIEEMQKGTRRKLEVKLKERNGTLVDIVQVNENIHLGSNLFYKGPLYWNAIIVEENSVRTLYRISEYLKLKTLLK